MKLLKILGNVTIFVWLFVLLTTVHELGHAVMAEICPCFTFVGFGIHEGNPATFTGLTKPYCDVDQSFLMQYFLIAISGSLLSVPVAFLFLFLGYKLNSFGLYLSSSGYILGESGLWMFANFVEGCDGWRILKLDMTSHVLYHTMTISIFIACIVIIGLMYNKMLNEYVKNHF